GGAIYDAVVVLSDSRKWHHFAFEGKRGDLGRRHYSKLMAGNTFLSYRRDDDPAGAARICDALAGKFGKSSIFMDVDKLLAGQRFDMNCQKRLLPATSWSSLSARVGWSCSRPGN